MYPDGANAKDLGVKYKFLVQKDDANDEDNRHLVTQLRVSPIEDFFTKDFMHYDKAKAAFDGRPEWALHKKDNFDLREDGVKPEITI